MIRRKNYFIKKKFQINFISRFIILLLLESVLTIALFMYVSSDTLTAGYFYSTLTVERTPHFFFISFLLITLIVIVGIGLAGMVVFVLLSHRIAGPLYRFEKVLKEIELGDFTTRVDLRRTDQLTELKEALNTLVGSLDSRMRRMKDRLAEAQELLSKKDDPESLSKLNKVIGLLKNEIDHFKITSSAKE